MKTTLPKLCFFAFLFFLVSCAKKAFIYSENLTKNFIGKTFDDGFISETNKPNNQVMSMNNNVGSYSVGRPFSSISNYNGSSASASASASVIDPATLSKTEDLVFGKVFLKHLKNKFVSLNEIGASFQRILVPNMYSNEAKAQACFSVGGANNIALDVNVPKQIDLYHKNGTDIISAIIDTKSNSKKSAEIYNYDFLINGKIYFNSLTVPGNYSSKDFAVTVHYN